jgi:hypothetical protein
MWAGHVGRRALNILTVTSTGKRRFEMPRRRWEDNIRMDLKEMGINTRIGIFVQLLRMPHCNSGSHKRWS